MIMLIAVYSSSTRTFSSQYAIPTDLTMHDYSTCPTAFSLVTAQCRSFPGSKFESSRELKNSRVWYQSKEQLGMSSAPPISLQTTTEIDNNIPEKGSNEQYLSRVSKKEIKYIGVEKYSKCRAALGKISMRLVPAGDSKERSTS
ncbi:hypothetical protein F511_19000 [Dorcoceras hygrometricum]|uniref:Uncharacterized protein n=1 Tax=Dorcoceras hygrometricum TaxID=472368 RepID=A0A2Z7DEC2_9LAMI|nr:hypothetical protein F511_19000 [Dorcoceras hygrometricum]